MQNVKKNKYIEPKIEILLVEDYLLIGSNNTQLDCEPEIEKEPEEEEANPYWPVL